MKESVQDILLFVPNIIGYFRILFWTVACYLMNTNYVVSFICYLVSSFLDAFDGHAARALNQCTKFGAMLDMLLDRVATMTLIVCLCNYYPDYLFYFQISMAIDIASHWLHMHAAISSGATSHKAIDLDKNKILHVYYTNRKVLFAMCAGNELFYSSLYLCYHTPGPYGIFRLLALLTAPVAFAKFVINLIHLYCSALNMASLDVQERSKAIK